jgi:uncharacterized protein
MTTTEIITTASLIGLAGSLHCVGMCGPLALALPVQRSNNWLRAVAATVYNTGRVVSYTLMGTVFGGAGQIFIASQWQARLSIALGALILLYLFIPKKYLHLPSAKGGINQPFVWVRKKLSALLQSGSSSSLFVMGMLNGLLPCGLVYLALGSAVVTGSMVRGGMFMLFFGLGTFLLMWTTVFMGAFIGQGIRLKLKRALPVMLFFIAALLILRGLGLGIPYISPAAVQPNGHEVIVCH